MGAPAATTIAGVSVLTEDRGPGDAFDIGLSPAGIEIRRPGRDPRHLPWGRVSEWELEERSHDVVLTLRGDGAATPLVITGWSVGELESLLRSVTAPEAISGGLHADSAEPPDSPAEPAPAPAPAPNRRERARGRNPLRRVGAKATVTIVLLVLLAAAVTLVLLQSAGVIDWGFLGPTA